LKSPGRKRIPGLVLLALMGSWQSSYEMRPVSQFWMHSRGFSNSLAGFHHAIFVVSKMKYFSGL